MAQSANSINFTQRTLVIVTGASQGIGRSICVELSLILSDESVFFLIARSADGLNQTKKKINEINSKITVKTFSVDLSTATLQLYEALFSGVQTQFENAIIFHNAGSLGTLDRVCTYTDINVWTQHFNLNVFSASLLNSVYLETMRTHAKRLFVVNISSMCGTQPFKNMGMYGSAKASRDLIFKVLALEESDISVLNYSPGPVDTNMVANVIANIKDHEMRARFSDLKMQRTILKPDVTVSKLLSILMEGEFKSGDLIDYFDRV